MNTRTRERLVGAASALFAEHGYRGASVRDICNLARANPGAVSYHFGGKRQLYRIVLRHAVERLAQVTGAQDVNAAEDLTLQQIVRGVFRRLRQDPVATRLLLRDLADGGTLGVEALEPPLRGAVEALRRTLGHAETDRVSAETKLLFLEIAAPVFLLTAAWPAVARPLQLDEGDREELLDQMIRPVCQPGRAESSSSV